MNNNSLASVYAAALRPTLRAQSAPLPAPADVVAESQPTVALSSILMTAVNLSFSSGNSPYPPSG